LCLFTFWRNRDGTGRSRAAGGAGELPAEREQWDSQRQGSFIVTIRKSCGPVRVCPGRHGPDRSQPHDFRIRTLNPSRWVGQSSNPDRDYESGIDISCMSMVVYLLLAAIPAGPASTCLPATPDLLVLKFR